MKAGFKNRLKKDVFEALLRQDTGYFDANDGGALQRALQHDTAEVAHKFNRDAAQPLQQHRRHHLDVGRAPTKCGHAHARCIAFAAATMPVVKG